MTSAPLVWWQWDLAADHLRLEGETSGLIASPAGVPGWEAFVHPDDLPGLRAAVQACREGGAPEWSWEHRVRRTDASWHRVLNHGRVAARDGTGAPSLMTGILLDLTERLRMEESLRRDAQMLANVRESMVCTDLNGIVTYWNAGATELYGWSAAEMVGRAFYERMPTEAMRAHARMRMRTAATQGEFRSEREDFRKDGTRIYVDSRVFAIRDAAGQVCGVLGMGHDITARRQAELDRLQLERQLLQSQKMETIGTLAAGMAHEFNNILAAIIGNTEMALLMNPDDVDHRGYHETVLRSSWRARDLVRRILAISRQHEPERRPVPPAQAVAEAADLVRATLPATVELRVEPAADAPAILVDPHEFQQVLLNLAANAAYAMRERSGQLTFRTRTVDLAGSRECAVGRLAAGRYVALEVIDTGRGIGADHLARIFDPFFTTKPIGEGSGLGLAIVHNIVIRHRGGIDVASSPGTGTAFTLYFPVAPAGASPAPAEEISPIPLEPARGRGERIVVIDDEEAIASVVVNALEQLGYAVRGFASAEEFYASFHSAPFPVDLILTDQTMPRLTGQQLARRLRAEGHAFPIVIISGFNPESPSAGSEPVARVTYLEKPFNLTRLTATLRRLLDPA